MKTQNQAAFINDKIKQLETAILYSDSSSVLKLPSAIVYARHIDEAGCVWLAMSKPLQYVHEFDKSFHSTLNFYRKGSPFFLNILGMARVVIDPEEINLLPAELSGDFNAGKLILCVRILEAKYYEKQNRNEQGLMQKFKSAFQNMFVSNEFYYNSGGRENFA